MEFSVFLIRDCLSVVKFGKKVPPNMTQLFYRKEAKENAEDYAFEHYFGLFQSIWKQRNVSSIP